MPPDPSPALNDLVQLRKYLHQHPELSGQEQETARFLQRYLQAFQPSDLLSGLGSGTGLVALWDSGQPGPTILFRAELDALPIPEEEAGSAFPYFSRNAGVSHKCGHDGHATMVAGLAPFLQENPPARGKVGLLFQPAEETGEGAAALLQDPRFTNLKPDYIFGLHNLPGFPEGQVVLREGGFCAASRGMRITLEGRTSHAAEPEKAHSPAACVARLLQELPQIPQRLAARQLVLLTLTHARLGEPSFSITPGMAVVQATLRAFQETDMQQLIATTEQVVRQEAQAAGLGVQISYEEVFSATENHPEAFALLQTVAQEAGVDVALPKEPFRWSEDFGRYAQIAKIGFFGLGAGEQQPNLHHPAYDFPDQLIPHGLRMYQALVAACLAPDLP
ncbi:amidohydrolase [Rufibacter glacialis]|uniref:Amidohydrolase n=1 Tax=Rufibacter glacialis TaxID=1259555 RepID=A0A5M8QB92_9BACT|nr:amidohydrolase [Rufibacter glacialis]KAA6433229.1 amidohydrolase [Rufibacter glacialis]GGK76286.1 peptidase M20 [Rufibacter glacialis]